MKWLPMLIYFAILPGLVCADVGRVKQRATWKSYRDAEIEKQDKDYSCGAASLATILRYFYGIETDEAAVLEKVPNLDGDLSASFAELSMAANRYGFKTISVEADFKKLVQLKIPALAYVRHEGQDHFTVIRGVDKLSGRVWLADSSWGNRFFTRHQFMRLWTTENTEMGKLLVVGPDIGIDTIQRSFFKAPPDRLELAIELVQHSTFGL